MGVQHGLRIPTTKVGMQTSLVVELDKNTT